MVAIITLSFHFKKFYKRPNHNSVTFIKPNICNQYQYISLGSTDQKTAKTAGVDPKFVQLGVWGEKGGIKVKISENLHVYFEKRCIWSCII